MSAPANQPLPPGHQLEQYRIERQLSVGGFSIVYLARDAQDQPVAIKEYLPHGLALRTDGGLVPSIPPESMGTFNYGMKCFFEEGRALAGLNHPNVVRVLNFFRANRTVYMVMRYEQGHTMLEYLLKHRRGLRESFLRHTFTRLLNGLREVHLHKLLHLDIKPANIYLRADGSPVLLDFGAARQTLANDGRLLKPMYTPGYAPPEQYNHKELLGPWSDIYSVGASMYACLGAKPPPPADQRLEKDLFVPAVQRWANRYSIQFLDTIDWCLKLDHLERPQSVFAVQKALAESGLTPEHKKTKSRGTAGVKLEKSLAKTEKVSTRYDKVNHGELQHEAKPSAPMSWWRQIRNHFAAK